MSEPREIRCYQYVNRPYEKVAAVLTADPTAFFKRATAAAATRAEDLAGKLKVKIAGFEIDRDVAIDVTAVDTSRKPPGALVTPGLAMTITWRAVEGAVFFPSMRAELTVYPLSGEETQLDLRGAYTPPGGLLGNAADALVGHRIAEASVHRFLHDRGRQRVA